MIRLDGLTPLTRLMLARLKRFHGLRMEHSALDHVAAATLFSEKSLTDNSTTAIGKPISTIKTES